MWVGFLYNLVFRFPLPPRPHVCTNLPYIFFSGWNFTVAAILVARTPCSNKHFHSHSTFHWRTWTLWEKLLSLAKTFYVSSCLSNVSKFIFLTTIKSAVFLRIVWPTELRDHLTTQESFPSIGVNWLIRVWHHVFPIMNFFLIYSNFLRHWSVGFNTL